MPNKSYYPEEFKNKTRLSYYGFLFNSIEINSSFYKVPRKTTIAQWATEVPDDFRFTFKLWKGITHQPGLIFDPGDIAGFMDTISPAEHKKGCLLIQFPGKIDISYASQINKILKHVQRYNTVGWNIQVEFRNMSLYHPKMDAILKKRNAAVVMHDIQKSATPSDIFKTPVVYLRFHGPEKGYRGDYAEQFLMEYSQLIKVWAKEKREVYIYFNNTLGNAIGNLITMNAFLKPDSRHSRPRSS